MAEFRSGSGSGKNSSLGIQENIKDRDQPTGQFSLKEFLYLSSPVWVAQLDLKALRQKRPSHNTFMHHIVDLSTDG